MLKSGRVATSVASRETRNLVILIRIKTRNCGQNVINSGVVFFFAGEYSKVGGQPTVYFSRAYGYARAANGTERWQEKREREREGDETAYNAHHA